MTKPRSQLVSIADTPYYHVVSRCVRRAFLCGEDKSTGKSYEHRRQWIEERIRILSTVFAVDVASYAVMSNHYHIVVKLNPQSAENWSLCETVSRWLCLFKGSPLMKKYHNGKPLSEAEMTAVNEQAEKWKERLCSLSWFMKCLNEPIARQANIEDRCTGHFWEGRYHSDALLTDEAVLTAMAYVDLNPVRAKMADTPETSDYTSIKERIKPQFNLGDAIANHPDINHKQLKRFDVKALVKFETCLRSTDQGGILYAFDDYLRLVDQTGRIQRQGKRGAISDLQSPILERLNIDLSTWMDNTANFETNYQREFSHYSLALRRRFAA